MKLTTEVSLMLDPNHHNFVHLYYPQAESKNLCFLCTVHIDQFYDLFGEFNYRQIKATLKSGSAIPFTLVLVQQS